jgi:hypothetical protein
MKPLIDLLKTINTSELSNYLATLFDDDWLEEQAQKTGFIVRKRSGLSGCMLLIMNVLELSIHSNHSLQEQCE